MSVSAEVEKLYSGRDHHILPFVGEAFERPRGADLRVVAVGVNSYVSESDWWKVAEGRSTRWFQGWWREPTHRFPRGAQRALDELGQRLGTTAMFNGLGYRGIESTYATNAVKTHLKRVDGRRSSSVKTTLLDDHMPTWFSELDVMARHDAVPHVIVVFGRRWWGHAWRSLRDGTEGFKDLRVVTGSFRSAQGTSHHYLNRVEVETTAGRRSMLLVGLRHASWPAAPMAKGTAGWLLEQADFRAMVAG